MVGTLQKHYWLDNGLLCYFMLHLLKPIQLTVQLENNNSHSAPRLEITKTRSGMRIQADITKNQPHANPRFFRKLHHPMRTKAP